MTTMDDLTAFITARLDEDEAAATALQQVARAAIERLKEPRLLGCEIPGWHSWPDVEAMCSRTLREVAAKRRILAEHRPFTAWEGPDADDACCAAETSGNDAYAMSTPWPCTTARAIAAIWNDHHDYKPGWAIREPS